MAVASPTCYATKRPNDQKGHFSHQARPIFLFRQPARRCECQSFFLFFLLFQPFETPNPHSPGRLHSKPPRPRCNAISSKLSAAGPVPTTTKPSIIFFDLSQPLSPAYLQTTSKHCALLLSRHNRATVLRPLLRPLSLRCSKSTFPELLGAVQLDLTAFKFLALTS